MNIKKKKNGKHLKKRKRKHKNEKKYDNRFINEKMIVI